MFGRVINEGIAGSSVTVDPVSRAELSLGTTPPGAEIPGHAVAEVLKSQSAPKELPPHIHEKAKVIGLIQKDMKDMEARAASAKELEEMRAKLLLGHKDASDGRLQTHNVGQAVHTALSVPAIALRIVGGQESSNNWPGMKKNASAQSEKTEKDPNIVGQADQQKVIGRIDDALMAVDKLLGQIDSDQLAANTRLLNLTGSMAGLNAARSTVDSTPLSLSVAMNAAEMIMTNVKTAVVSHGYINTDIVRLVMS